MHSIPPSIFLDVADVIAGRQSATCSYERDSVMPRLLHNFAISIMKGNNIFNNNSPAPVGRKKKIFYIKILVDFAP